MGSDAEGKETERRRSASYWATRHESGDAYSESELTEWEAWVSDPENAAEFHAMVCIPWSLKALPRPRIPGDAEVRESFFRDALAAGGKGRAQRKRAISRTGWGLAACVLIGAAVIWSWREAPVPLTMDSAQLYATATAEQRQVPLPDGSEITLAANSILRVELKSTLRAATLLRGEARFHVQHERRRPFTVFAGAGSITAVGTVFDVHRYSDRVLVAVSDGAVEVAPGPMPPDNLTTQGGSAPPTPRHGDTTPSHADNRVERTGPQAEAAWIPLRVARGEEMTYDSHGDASAPRTTDTHLIAAWTEGSLAYRGRPLREVIEDVQRYTSRRIELDVRAADLQYTGTFIERDVEQWLRALPRIFPVEVVESDPGHVLIRARLPASQEAHANPNA